MSMTPKQVYVETVKGGNPDRRSVAMLDGGAWQCQSVGKSLHDVLASPDAGAALSIKSAADWGSDIVWTNMAGFGPFMEAMGCEVDFTKVGQAGTILKPAIDSIDEVGKLPQDAAAIREMALANTHVTQVLKQLEGIHELNEGHRAVGLLMTGPFTFAGQLMNMDAFIKGVIRKPKEYADYIEWATMAQQVWGDLLIEHGGGDTVLIADPLASGDVISPRVYQNLAKSTMGSLIAHLKQQAPEMSVMVHMCGHSTMRLAEQKEIGVDVFAFDKNDFAESIEIVDGDYAFFGNVPPSEILLNGSVEDVTNEAKRILDGFDGYAKFVLGTGCDLAPSTPLENIKAMSGAVR